MGQIHSRPTVQEMYVMAMCYDALGPCGSRDALRLYKYVLVRWSNPDDRRAIRQRIDVLDLLMTASTI